MVITLILVLTLLVSSIGFKRDSPDTSNITYVNTVDISINGGPFEKLKLPADLDDLAPGTPITLKAVIKPKADDGLYFKTIYSKADVYFNNKHVFEFGKDENYPRFMKDPATEIHIIETYGTNEDMDVRIEITSPHTVKKLHLFPLMVGSVKEIILSKSFQFGFSWILSISLIISGIALIITSLGIMFIDKKAVLFTWLGLFSLVTGSWFMGSNDFAITIFPDTTFLYMMSFIGVVMFLPALLQYINTAIDFENPKFIIYVKCFTVFVAVAALALQLLGIVPLHISRYITRIMLIPILVYITGLIIFEYIKYNNYVARLFIVPMIIFTLSSVAEVIMKSFPLSPVYFPPAMLGTLLFLLIMGFIAGRTVKDSVDLQKRERELAFEKELLDIQTVEQRESRLLLVENEKLLSRQRHDLRHHLTVIQELVGDDNVKLQEYISTVVDKIPKKKETYCENSIVNAVISHFASECEMHNIQFNAELIVPDTDNFAIDSDLCVVFANLLENATEACSRMTEGNKFVTIKSTFDLGRLTIIVDNSFNGEFRESKGCFYSSKRNEIGTGLSSVTAIAKKYHGSTRYTPENNTFMSSAYLNLK